MVVSMSGCDGDGCERTTCPVLPASVATAIIEQVARRLRAVRLDVSAVKVSSWILFVSNVRSS